jgi:hypothetical protein
LAAQLGSPRPGRFLGREVFVVDGPQITHLPQRAVVRRARRSSAVPAGGSNEFESTVVCVEALVIRAVGIGRLDRGIE